MGFLSGRGSQWKGLGPSNRKYYRLLIIALATVVILSIVVPIAVVFYVKQGEASWETSASISFDTAPTEGLLFGVLVTSVDAINSLLKAKVTVKPLGDLAMNPSDALDFSSRSLHLTTVPLQVTIEGKWINIPTNTSLVDHEVSVLLDGDYSSYPMDTYHTWLEFTAFVVQGNTSVPLPAHSASIGALQSFNIFTTSTENAKDLTANTVVEIERSVTTKVFSIFIMILMWILSLIAFSVSMNIWFHDKRIEAPMVAAVGALLFALPGLRNVMPNAPPVGSTADVASFFWNMVLVSLSLTSCLVNYLVRYAGDVKSAK